MTPDEPNPPVTPDLVRVSTGGALGSRPGGRDALPFAPGPAQSESEGAGAGNALRRYGSALLRFKWFIIATLLLGMGAGIALSRRVKLTYVVQATLWMEPGGGGTRGPIEEGKLLKEETAWTELLKSYSVLDHVVQDQHLYLEVQPANTGLFANFELKERFLPGEYILKVSENGQRVTLQDKSGKTLQTASPGDSIGAKLGFIWLPARERLHPSRTVPFAVRRPRDVARNLGSQLQARMQKNGSFIQLELRGREPERLASTLNAVVDRFVQVATDLKRARLDEFALILNEQLKHAEQSLQDAEFALENFRINTITLPTEAATPVAPGLSETRSPVMTSFLNLKVEQDLIRRDRAAVKQAIARAGSSTISVPELETIAAVQSSSELKSALGDLSQKRAELRALQYRYTDEYADIKRLRSEMQTLEREIIPRLVGNLVQELDRRDQQIEGFIGSASTELRDIPPRVMEEARLSRRVAIASNLYTTLRQRSEEAELAAMSSRPDLSVLDKAAVPDRPIEDQRRQLILIALLGSLGLAIGGVLLLDQLDPRVRYPEQVTAGLRLPILAAIPRLSNTNGRFAKVGENTAQVVEAFRELRLRLLQNRGSDGRLVTTITSPGSGDGKSFVVVNLALSFADQGYRTLLIDGDVRRGDIHRFLGRPRSPGLTDVLAGTAHRLEAVQGTAYPNLDLIASGKRIQSGPELLGSSALPKLLDQLRAEYAVVLMDSAPLGAGVDPFVLATMTDNVVIVLRAGQTDRQMAEAKLSGLDALPVNVLGAVFNGVAAGGVYRYYSYLPGYEAPEEDRNAGHLLSEPAEQTPIS